MGSIVLMIANYFHDLAVALLVANVFAIWFVGRHFDQHPQRDVIVRTFFTRMSRITYGALAYVIAGGALRAYFFMEFEWNPAVGRGQVAALVVKHVLLVTLTVFGLVVQSRYRRRYAVDE